MEFNREGKPIDKEAKKFMKQYGHKTELWREGFLYKVKL